jgi:hypothetical protein
VAAAKKSGADGQLQPVIRAKARLEAGSCAHQPPMIRHPELGHSDDIEVFEVVVLPAGFATEEVASVQP